MVYRGFLAGTALCTLLMTPAHAAFFHIGSGSIDGSLCVGNDCVSAEAFGFDTIRLKENNLRIHFDDTSTAAAFPPNDWRLYANDSANGGDSYFGIEDATAGRFVFRVFAGARSNALTVDSQGDVGIGTATPATDIDIKIGDTPTVRLQQDGTSGFTPQTWDMAGNEAGFFIRDVTNGSTLPFRIIPGASSNALVIDDDDDIGIGAGVNPEANLHITDTDGSTEIRLDDGSSGDDLKLELIGDAFNISFNGTGAAEFQVQKGGDVLVPRGNLIVDGTISSGGTTLNVPDYVFAEGYQLMPMDELRAFVKQNRHLPGIPSAAEVKAKGLNMTEMQMALLEKVEELTLYTLKQEATILKQQETIDHLERLVVTPPR